MLPLLSGQASVERVLRELPVCVEQRVLVWRCFALRHWLQDGRRGRLARSARGWTLRARRRQARAWGWDDVQPGANHTPRVGFGGALRRHALSTLKIGALASMNCRCLNTLGAHRSVRVGGEPTGFMASRRRMRGSCPGSPRAGPSCPPRGCRSLAAKLRCAVRVVVVIRAVMRGPAAGAA